MKLSFSFSRLSPRRAEAVPLPVCSPAEIPRPRTHRGGDASARQPGPLAAGPSRFHHPAAPRGSHRCRTSCLVECPFASQTPGCRNSPGTPNLPTFPRTCARCAAARGCRHHVRSPLPVQPRRAQPRRFPFLPHLSSSTAPMIKAANPPRLTPCCRGSGDPAAAPWPPERFGCAPERPRIARGSARGVPFNLWDFGANWGSFSAWQKVWGRGAASLA